MLQQFPRLHDAHRLLTYLSDHRSEPVNFVLPSLLAEKRLFPAMNLAASGTRKEDKLLDEKTLSTITALRRRMLNMHPDQQIEQQVAAVSRFETNDKLVGLG